MPYSDKPFWDIFARRLNLIGVKKDTTSFPFSLGLIPVLETWKDLCYMIAVSSNFDLSVATNVYVPVYTAPNGYLVIVLHFAKATTTGGCQTAIQLWNNEEAGKGSLTTYPIAPSTTGTDGGVTSGVGRRQEFILRPLESIGFMGSGNGADNVRACYLVASLIKTKQVVL